ncbi:MAG: nitroreductase [Pseudomonadota bacterium]
MAALRDYLATRRTVPAKLLGEPGPGPEALERMLTIAARVPDHGKLAPWRFIVFTGEARALIGERFAEIADPSDPELIAMEESRFTRAPVVVAVVSTAAIHPKIPEWEQVLSAGAVCMNLLHAAVAHGFTAQWLTEWMAYDDAAKAAIGVAPNEQVAGFIHIGTATTPPTERGRPDMAALVTYFHPPA